VFEEVLGIPAHPLILHAAVVFIPLQVLSALAYGFVPAWRRYIAWAVASLIVIAPAAALLAKLSGDAFRARLVNRKEVSSAALVQIDIHRSYGTMTVYFTAGLSVLMLLMLLADRVATKATTVSGVIIQPNGSMVLGVVLTAAVVAGAAVTGYYVFKTGDTGAHVVWGSY
jgi:hypothetical protein